MAMTNMIHVCLLAEQPDHNYFKYFQLEKLKKKKKAHLSNPVFHNADPWDPLFWMI